MCAGRCRRNTREYQGLPKGHAFATERCPRPAMDKLLCSGPLVRALVRMNLADGRRRETFRQTRCPSPSRALATATATGALAAFTAAVRLGCRAARRRAQCAFAAAVETGRGELGRPVPA